MTHLVRVVGEESEVRDTIARRSGGEDFAIAESGENGETACGKQGAKQVRKEWRKLGRRRMMKEEQERDNAPALPPVIATFSRSTFPSVTQNSTASIVSFTSTIPQFPSSLSRYCFPYPVDPP